MMKKFKLLACALIALMLLACAVPFMVSAAEPATAATTGEIDEYDLWIAGVQVTESYLSNAIEGWSFDPATNTLTLNNANIVNSKTEGGTAQYGIYSTMEDTLNVVLVGESTVSSNTSCAIEFKDVVISGEGKLTATAGYSGAITCQSMTIEGVTIVANCSGDIGNAIGVVELTVNSGNITANGASYGIMLNSSAGFIKINGGTVIATCNKYRAFHTVPDLTGYTNHIAIASTSNDGSNPVIYNSGNNSSYKYVKIEPAYKVSFDANGGSGAPESAFVNSERKLPSLPVPTKDGAVFRGWYMGEEKVTTDTVFTQDTTVVAKWTEKISVSYLDAEGKQQTCDAIPLDSELTELAEGWYVVESDIEVSKRITVSGDVHLILADGKTLKAEQGGINVGEGNGLTIYSQSLGTNMGSLIAKSTSISDAGIGGNYNQISGTITINGGNITATACSDAGFYGAAGIGGGALKSAGTITINGGNVIATAGPGAAGIGQGCGSSVSNGTTVINGGTVRATGNEWGQGLGGEVITINGGSVEAIGDAGFAINNQRCTLTFAGGTIIAWSANNCAFDRAISLPGNLIAFGSESTEGTNPVIYNSGSNSSYKYVKIQPAVTVTFDVNDGDALDPASEKIVAGGKLTTLPVPTNGTAEFLGWYTAEGVKVTGETTFDASQTVTARWGYALWIKGERVTGDKLSGEGWSYDPATQTLTLNGITITEYFGTAIESKIDGLIVNLVGTNNISSKGYGNSCLSPIESSMTIQGEGTLELGGTSDAYAIKGSTNGSSLIINGGTVKANATIYADGITVNGGTVISTSPINSGKNLEITGGTVENSALYAYYYIIISGGNVDINAASDGIYGFEGITISGGSVNVKATGTASYGLFVNQAAVNPIINISVDGVTVSGDAGAINMPITLSGTNKLIAIASASTDGSNSVIYNKDDIDTYKYIKIEPAVTVEFDTDGGSEIAAIDIPKGGKLPTVTDPTKTGYRFIGWYTAKTEGTKITGETAFDSDTTVYAQWAKLYELWIGGVQVGDDLLTGTGDSGTWTFDPATSTLTLDNFKYTGGGYDDRAISAKFDLKIVVLGTNEIHSTEEHGIGVDKNLEMSGTGKLSIRTTPAEGWEWSSTAITVDGDVTIKDISLDIQVSGWGIDCYCHLTLDNVTANIHTELSICLFGADSVSISNSTLLLNSNSDNCIVSTGGDIEIENSTVVATGNLALSVNPGLNIRLISGTYQLSGEHREGAIYIDGSTLTLPTVEYWWRTDANGDYTASTTQAFSYNKQAYVEITTNDPTITVTFEVNGGDALTSATQKVGIDGKLTSLPVPTKKGFYKFEGWFTAETGGTKVTTDNVYTENTTLYARWSEVVSDGIQTVLNVSKGNIVIGDQTVSGYDPDGNHITTPDPDGYILTGTSSVDEKKVWITGGDQILTLRDLSIDVANIKWSTAFNIDGGSHTITLEGKNVLKSGLGCAGLNVNDVSSITITAESTGSLLVRGGDTSRGDIGYRGDKNSGGTININGGKIDANSIGGRSISITGGQFATGDVIAGVVCGRSLPIEYYVKKVDDASCPYLVTTEIPEMLPSDGEKTLLNINHGHAGIGHNVVDAYLNDGTHLTKADPDGYIITGSSNVDEKKVTIFRGEFDIVIRDLSIDVSGSNYAPAFNVESPAKLTLTLEGNNVLKSGKECAGLTLSGDGATLVITADSTGTLTAVGGDYGAGIGSRYWGTCGDITINGGSINARGQNGADAIGAGNGGGCGTITISGGKFAVGDVGAGTVYGIKVADEAEVIYLGDEETYRYSVGMQYNITFDYNDGATASVTEKTKSNGKLASLPTPTRIGYLFDAWYDAVAAGNKVDTNTVFTSDTTIYARWIACNHAASTAKPDCTNGATCSVCGGSISALNHDFAGGPMINNDPAGHYKKCSRCPAVDSANIGYHALANGCDPVCEICGYTRPIWHNYQFKLNDEQHWMACTICGQVEPGTVGGHTGGSANCTDRAVCEICLHAYGEVDSDKHQPPATFHSGRPSDCLTNTYGYSYFYSCVCGERFYDEDCKQPVGGDSLKLEYLHTIKFYRGTAATCCTDGTASYWLCIKCNKKFSDSPAVTEITDLRIPATGAHKASAWSSDEMSHWRICEVGGVKFDAAAHGFGADNVCDTCGYTKPEETTTPPEETTAPPEETTAPPEETTTPPEETTAPPEETTAPPEETTTPPEETTTPPEETTTPPEETTTPPEETTTPPEETTTPPDETTEPPVETTEPPVETTEPPVETTEPPVETTEPPVETTEPPVETTEPPVETTEPPVETTEPPVETTEPPVETTEPAPETTVPDHSGETGDSDSAMIFILLSIISIAAVAFIATRKEKRQN